MQPEPWAAPSGWRSPAIRWMPSPSKSTSVASSRCPPVTTTTSGPSACSARASCSTSSGAARPGEHPRLGQVRRDHGRARQQQCRPARRARRRRAAPRPTRRPSRGRSRRACRARAGRAPRRPRRRSPALPSIPIFTASTPMSSATARTCSTMNVRRHRVDARHADRVLRGQRGDRRHPVDAAARERLQVGLDPGAAAGVGAGDREHGGDRAGHAAQGRTARARLTPARGRSGRRTRAARGRAARAR